MFYKAITLFLCFNAILGDEIKDFQNYLVENIEETKRWKLPTEKEYFKEIPIDKCKENPEYYDFVIVGAGAAGCVLANRLTENPNFKVLLIEAGDDVENDFSDVPAARLTNLNSSFNWGYVSTRQKNFCLANGGICNLDRGLGLGGSTMINGMQYARGNKYDFQKWVELGNRGWSFEDVLPYYKKQETSLRFNDPSYRGANGPLNITVPYQVKDLYTAIFDGSKELGYKEIDYNGPGQIGIGFCQATILNGKRLSTNRAYLKPIRKRPNLTVFDKSLATKIFFGFKRAKRLQILQKDGCKLIKIGRELIVSSGVLNTPQLLMLSGIGPKAQLKKLSINVYKDLPVGQYLQVRPGIIYQLLVETNATFYNRTFDGDVESYLRRGTGMLVSAAAMDVSYYNYNSTTSTDKPVIEIMFSAANDFLTPEDYGTDKSKKVSFHYSPILQYPKSVGELTLRSKNPIDFPIINPRYLEDPSDIDGLYLGVRKLQQLLKTKAMREINATISEKTFEICKNAGGKDSESFWECYIRQKGNSLHILGTARMGVNSSNSVVDRNLKVHGVDNLRVIDASIFPHMVSGHFQATVVAVAEKMADKIKNLYKT